MSRIVKKIKRALGFGRAAANARVAAEMRQLDQQDRKRIEFYRQFIEPGDLVFDVGANLGNRAKLFLELNAKVVAFEPQKSCADLLELAFRADKNFRLLRTALGAQPGEATMFVSDAHTISTLSQDWVRSTTDTGRFGGVGWNKQQKVVVDTLDKIIAEHGAPRFIKIDVEGFEYEVLRGLSTPVPAVSIEFATESLQVTYKAMAHMCDLAPMLFQIALGEELEFIGERWMTRDEAQDKLRQLSEQDPMVWGDLYMKRAD
jgi:FkbM family methyltransferase